VARQTYAYFHMLAPSPLRPGAHVRAGRRVGALGCSGSCQGAHLHFEVHRGRGATGRGIDPLPFLHRWHRLARG
jgi:murein DD-endopeptidase MepM/ murein hydrolase activator NlpD